MPYFTTSAEWYEQSKLLLEARPTTARVVTKYSILKRKTTKDRKRQPTTSDPAAAAQTPAAQAPAAPQAALILKTYDPASGVCLKYQTTKAAEVGRLIASLEKLSRTMAALPDVSDDVAMLDAPAAEQGTGTNTPNPEPAAKPDSKPAQGGGKKKKKGKK
ncbi:hypothetical protein SLS56_006629 [Neofusicoccum ribis]|uniref:SRP9 domain-containing protein n=1 Tax=Neofusicoccum ribis TaxID=45134 RepID=A0ABR3SQC8_9PEZI